VDLDQVEKVQSVKAEIERALQSSGRVLLRSSGTEPLVRVMVEGSDSEQVKRLAHQLAQAVSESLA